LPSDQIIPVTTFCRSAEPSHRTAFYEKQRFKTRTQVDATSTGWISLSRLVTQQFYDARPPYNYAALHHSSRLVTLLFR